LIYVYTKPARAYKENLIRTRRTGPFIVQPAMYLDSQLLTAMRPAIVAPIRRGQSPIMAVTAFRARTSRSAIITLPTRVSRRAAPRALGPALTHCYRKTCPWVSMAAPVAIAAAPKMRSIDPSRSPLSPHAPLVSGERRKGGSPMPEIPDCRFVPDRSLDVFRFRSRKVRSILPFQFVKLSQVSEINVPNSGLLHRL
jgi:hypothetical protein